MQLAQNGKIYTCEILEDTITLGVIHDPNSSGASCSWNADAGIGQSVFFNLPSFVSDFLQPAFNYTHTCLGEQAVFSLTDTSVIQADWDFDDVGASDNIILNNLRPVHIFTSAGDHYVRCTLYYADGSRKKYGLNVRIKEPVQPFSLGRDTLVCEGSTLHVQPCLQGVSYLWQDGSENTYFDVTGNDTVILRISNGCGPYKDSLIVKFQDKHSITIGPDTALCFDQLLVLIEVPLLPGATYFWSNGEEGRQTALTQNGVNYVDVTMDVCTVRDTILLDVSPAYPILDLGADTSLCTGDTLILNAFNEGAEYLWQDGSIAFEYSVTTSELVDAEVRLGKCVSNDQIYVEFIERPEPNLGPDTIICKDDTLHLNVFAIGSNYLWQDGSIGPVYQVYEEGSYRVEVKRENCIDYDTIQVALTNVPYSLDQKEYLLCEGDSLKLNLAQEGVTYLWNNTSTDHFFFTDQAGEITIRRENKCGIVNDTIEVKLEIIPWLEITGDLEACWGDTIPLNVKSNIDFIWNNGSKDSMLFVTVPGSYIATVSNNCGSETKELKIDFQVCCEIGNIPNLITPNGDNLNDYLYFDCAKQEGWILNIYNRYGELLFTDTNYQNNWNGDGISEGIYFYSIRRGDVLYKGWVQIVR